MRTIVHLSDLHFGDIDARLLEPLIQTVCHLRPDVLAVSGDLTQRARTCQFRAAQAFLQQLPGHPIIVPGNHDIPLWNPFTRLVRPLRRFERFITGELAPFHADNELAILGLNTARALTFKNGRVNHRQLAVITRRFVELGSGVVRILVTHHPFDVPVGQECDLVGRARRAMAALSACRVDVLLAGHLHRSHADSGCRRYRVAGYSALVVTAGTALSTRLRGESNGFYLLRVDHGMIQITRFGWDGLAGVFSPGVEQKFFRASAGWQPDNVSSPS